MSRLNLQQLRKEFSSDPDLIIAYDSVCPCEIWINDKLAYKSVIK